MKKRIDSILDLSQDDVKKIWPNLVEGEYQIRSDFTSDYNCIAFSIGSYNEWIDCYKDSKWPKHLYGDEKIDSFIEFFRSNGFKLCVNEEYEEGIEKIALYTNKSGEFKHVALQTISGRWKSKLGDFEDIEHSSLSVLSSGDYGDVTVIMFREMKKPQ